jgi:hypothetical protein
MGFPATTVRPERARDAEQFLGHVTAAVSPGPSATTMAVTSGGSGASAGGGLSGAALFAGADVVGVLLADTDHDGRTRLGAVSAGDLADDPTFAGLVGRDDGLTVTSVRTAWSGFPILQAP